MKTNTIVTMPPYAPYLAEVVRHPQVSGIRLNTVMPLKGSIEDNLSRLINETEKANKDLWIDLKSRQLRVKSFGVPPFTEIRLSHEIEVYTPTKIYFGDRNSQATLLEVDKDRLILQEGPRRVVGPGESVTIPHPTLRIKGDLTLSDQEYIASAKKLGLNKFMLSFVESDLDVKRLKEFSPDATIISKIESQKGLDNLSLIYSAGTRLMAARGDLYMELHWPHHIVEATENILKTDKNSIVASRILDSLAYNPEPSSSDIGDLDNLLRMGYKTFMLGDEVCLKREPLLSAIGVLSYLAARYK